MVALVITPWWLVLDSLHDGMHSASLLPLLLFLFVGLFRPHLLPDEWRLRSRFSVECIRLLCSLSVSFSLSVASVSSDCVAFSSLSLPTEWQFRSRLSMECIRLRKREVRETEITYLLAETPSDLPRSLSGRMDIVASNLLLTRPVTSAFSSFSSANPEL
jgi:hypothetical protein